MRTGGFPYVPSSSPLIGRVARICAANVHSGEFGVENRAPRVRAIAEVFRQSDNEMLQNQ